MLQSQACWRHCAPPSWTGQNHEYRRQTPRVPRTASKRLFRHSQSLERRQRALHAALSEVTRPAVVFVRRSASASPHDQLVENAVDPDAPMWLVHDLGARNGELLGHAEGRGAFIYEEESGQLLPYQGSSVETGGDHDLH